MSADDLTDDQVKELRQALVQLQSDLQASASLGQHASKIRSHQVQTALTKFGSQDYGYCLKCFNPIGYQLLKKAPERRFCQECDVRP